MGWWAKTPVPFDFTLAYSDHENYARQVSHIRWQRSNDLLSRYSPEMNVDSMKRCLRDHYENTFLKGPFFSAYLPDFLTLCMHDSPAGFTWGNTATSVVTEIDPGSPADTPFWVCYQPPCSSVYAAFFFDAPLPEAVARPGSAARIGAPSTVGPDVFDERSLWWRMYRLLGGVAAAPAERFPAIRREFDALERNFEAMVGGAAGVGADEKAESLAAIHRNQLQSIEKLLRQFEEQWDLTSVPGKESDAHS
jgi:secernin